jgi:hypothetical protein
MNSSNLLTNTDRAQYSTKNRIVTVQMTHGLVVAVALTALPVFGVSYRMTFD